MLFSLLTAAAIAGPFDSPGFQETRWGMGPSEVQRVYPGSDWEDQTLTVSDARVAARDARLSFHFHDGGDGAQLTETRVLFTDIDPAEHHGSYRSLQHLLTLKYGEATSEQMDWTVPEGHPGADSVTEAVARDQIRLWSTWRMETTTITLYMAGEGGEPVLNLHYTSNALGAIYDRAAAQELLDEL